MMTRNFQRTWQGLDIDALPEATTLAPAGTSFYEQFYSEAEKSPRNWSGRGRWIEEKRRLGYLLDDLFAERGIDAHANHRILSLGAGFGLVEDVLVERGHVVDVQDCQVISIRSFRERHAGSGAFVCDARSISAMNGSYSAVCLIALEYAFNSSEYQELLREVARTLRPSGLAVLVSVSNLRARDVLLSWPRRLKDRLLHRGRPAVYWGYSRSVDVHARAAACAGMRVDSVLGLDAEARILWRLERVNHYWPLFTDAAQVVMLLRRAS